MRILVIEDQYDLAASIWDHFERCGHHIDHAADGISGLRRALSERFDAIILDLGLPRLDGLEVCREIRLAKLHTPILMLSSRDTLDDKIRGYDCGTDDYMAKPFSMRELEARLEVLTRKMGNIPWLIEYNGLTLDTTAMLASRNGRTIQLTRMQCAILARLLDSAPRVVDLHELSHLLNSSSEGAIHTHIYELRRLLDKPFDYPLIHSVRSIGYRIARL